MRGVSGIGSTDHHDAFRHRLPDAKRAKRCDAVWVLLSPESRRTLASHYHYRNGTWPPGTEGHLGSALVGVALGTATLIERNQLLRACSGASIPRSKIVIREAKERALQSLVAAHREWDTFWRSTRPTRTETQIKVEKFERTEL
jgi:hypothetical protein